ncbi:MAG: IPT/TIG domain-containing protein [Propionibacteriales bacterium]|nr:IPT/TIG domain-containing protein [Propionibacteriales bacterium]
MVSIRTTTHKRRSLGRRIATGTTLAAMAASTFLFTNQAEAATSTLVTITGVGPHLVTALTANQVITVTGTGFDEDVITGVAVAGCTAPSYIVVSPTSLVVKTDNTCTVGAGKVVTITDIASNTAVSVPGATGGGQALSFIAAPTIATASATVRPVVTLNGAGLAYADQTTAAISGTTKGGTVVKVISGATGFSTSTTTPLAASLGGTPLTAVTLVGTNGTAGNYFTGVLGAHAASAAPVLKITNNGVSKSFAYGAGGASAVAGTHDFTYAGSSISVSPTSGPSAGGNKLTITGSGFSLTGANDVVTVGGVACPLTTPAPTATVINCTLPATTQSAFEGPVVVKVAVTGGLTSVVSPTSTYTYLAQ